MASSKVGDYELLAKLGEGGMGAVYKARQISLQRTVALKILPPRLAQDSEFIVRLMREARATAKLNHPHIVAGIDVGMADGYHYFAMEYVEGQSLKALIQRRQVLPEVEVLRIGAAIAGALAHAHAAQLIHRDVKPDNILISSDGAPKLADLGLAKARDEVEDVSLTKTGATVGTPHYLAPEQARGLKDLDGRVDTYALGCTLYHAATGRTPFEAETSAVLMVKHLSEKMPHPQSLNPSLSPGFCTVLGRMLARSRDDRYSDLNAAVEDFQALLAGLPPKTPPLPAAKVNFTTGKQTLRRSGSPALHRSSSEGKASSAALAPPRRTDRQLPVAKRLSSLWLAGVGVAGVIIVAFLVLSGGRREEWRGGRAADGPVAQGPKAPLLRPQEPPPAAPRVESHQPPAGPVPTPVPKAPRSKAQENWTPLFDGKSIKAIRSAAFDAWRVEDGAIVNVPGTSNAAQTMREFSNGALRIRFTAEDLSTLIFAVRQGEQGSYYLMLNRPELAPINGQLNEIVFKMRGESVSATLNGQEVTVSSKGSPKLGCFQFNASGARLKIHAIDLSESLNEEF